MPGPTSHSQISRIQPFSITPMKPFSKLGSLALVVILSLAAGCKKGQKNYTPLPGYSGTPGASSGLGKGQPILPPARPLTGDGAGANGADAATGVNNPDGANGQPSREEIEGMLADREQFKANTVYFDYDKSAVKADGKANVQAVASYLKAHSETRWPSKVIATSAALKSTTGRWVRGVRFRPVMR